MESIEIGKYSYSIKALSKVTKDQFLAKCKDEFVDKDKKIKNPLFKFGKIHATELAKKGLFKK